MESFGKVFFAIFGGIITLAIVSELVSRKSVFPQAIQASSTALATTIAAAVAPVHTSSTNGNLGLTAFSSSALPGLFSSPFGGS